VRGARMSVRPRAEDLALRRETGERRRALEPGAQLVEPLLARLIDLVGGAAAERCQPNRRPGTIRPELHWPQVSRGEVCQRLRGETAERPACECRWTLEEETHTAHPPALPIVVLSQGRRQVVHETFDDFLRAYLEGSLSA